MTYLEQNLRTIPCDDLDTFWNCISPIGSVFGKGLFVYRGHGDSQWRLTPKIFRTSEIEKYRAGMQGLLGDDHPTQTLVEFLLLRTFLMYCDKRGLAVPGDSMAFRDYLNRVMTIHRSQNHTWPEPQIIPLMALAQHHGVPTRLLDITSQAYVAAYFAAMGAIDQSARSEDARLAVFGIQQGTLLEINGTKTVQVPGSTSPNLSAQSGAFLLVENAGWRGEPFQADVAIEDKLATIPPHPNINDLSDQAAQPLVYKITLPIRFAAELQQRCEIFGVSAANIFPGYDGAARATAESYLVAAMLNTIKR